MWFDRPTLHSFPLIPSNELSKPTLDKFTEIVRRKGIDLGGDFDVVVESHRDLTNHPSIEDVKQAVDGVVKTVMWRRRAQLDRYQGTGRIPIEYERRENSEDDSEEEWKSATQRRLG